MPVALRAGVVLVLEEGEGESSWERSRARVFFGAVLLFLGRGRVSFSSAARRASFSAFLRAPSAFFCSSASLAGGWC